MTVWLGPVGYNRSFRVRRRRPRRAPRPGLLAAHAGEIASHVDSSAPVLATYGCVPSYYLRYYDSHDAVVAEQRKAGTRAAAVRAIETELLPAIEEVLARCRQEWAIEEEAAALRGTDGAAEDKIATRRLVDQAKAALMDRNDLAEDEAFTFIQQTAMHRRARMRDVARQIVDGTLTP